MRLPDDYRGLIDALSEFVSSADAGMLVPDQCEDPDLIEAALAEASLQTGVPIQHVWLGGDRTTLAWLRADDSRLASPSARIVGVQPQGQPGTWRAMNPAGQWLEDSALD